MCEILPEAVLQISLLKELGLICGKGTIDISLLTDRKGAAHNLVGCQSIRVLEY